jgi:Zn-dependent M28 family amino/carboxypeptidase
MIKMPGKTHIGPLPAMTVAQASMRDELVCEVEKLSSEIGERNIWRYQNLTAAADFIETSLGNAGYKINRQNFRVQSKICCNIEVEVIGGNHPEQIVIIGTHYDSVFGSPGANDNGSGVAALLVLARCFVSKKADRTLRFVFFVNEEPPFFQTNEMGSLIYAKSCRTNCDDIIAMLCLESIGYYSEQPGSQRYPFPFNLIYPSTGDFIGFVSNFSSRKILHTAIASFRKNCRFPSQGAAVPEIVPGINWSDHWSFWRQDYPAIMVTDTAPFRYPYYHTCEDTPDKIDYDRLARVVSGLQSVVADLVECATTCAVSPMV